MSEQETQHAKIIAKLNELREQEYEADAGDGFQRASDEQIKKIADLFVTMGNAVPDSQVKE